MSTSKIGARIALLSARAAPLASAIAGALSVTTSTAWAQQGGLDEIVVTARYREENIQTTPISISAFSGEELEIRSIENVEDIGLVIPNAYFRRNTSNFGPNNTIGLRGLNQVDFSYAFEPTVGVYIDDVYHSTITGSDMDLIDLERVEVLRGPQGTLFGKNSIGGAIRLISKAPQGDDTGMVSVTLGDYDRLDLKAIGDFALVEDKFFVRLVGVAKQQDGYGASLDFTCEMIRRGTPQLAGIGDGLGFGGFGPDSTGPTGDFDTLPDLLPPIAVPVGERRRQRFLASRSAQHHSRRHVRARQARRHVVRGGPRHAAFPAFRQARHQPLLRLGEQRRRPERRHANLADQQRHGQRVRQQRRVSPLWYSLQRCTDVDRRRLHELRDVRRSRERPILSAQLGHGLGRRCRS